MGNCYLSITVLYSLNSTVEIIRCMNLRSLRPFIDSEINHKRHFIKKNRFINRGIEFIDSNSIFRDKSVTSSIPTYFPNSESQINNLL